MNLRAIIITMDNVDFYLKFQIFNHKFFYGREIFNAKFANVI